MRDWPAHWFGFFEHLHAPRVRLASLRFRATLFGGLLSTALFAILTVTGVLLMYVYVPSEDGAWASIQVLEERVRFGRTLRALHNWTAQAMVVTVVLHLFSLAWRGAYERAKAANWWVGVLLFLLTVALSYTGYLLPWDQLAFWAITVGANMAGSAPVVGGAVKHVLLGSDAITGTTLLRFYVHHCITLPLVFAGLLSVHLYRIRRDGGLTLSPRALLRGGQSKTRARGAILRWELWLTLLVTLLALLLSFVAPIPFGPQADPLVTPNPMKAPWYLVGLQELLHFHPAFFVTYIVPGAFVGFLLAMPLLPARFARATLAGLSRPVALGLYATLAVVIVGSTPLWAWHWDLVLILTCLLAGALLWLGRGPLAASLGRMSLAVYLLGWLFGSYAGLTAVAVWLRGPNWGLLWFP
jgi:quinol-cytochrome oxidoreductase complex cytochrome b subunit